MRPPELQLEGCVVRIIHGRTLSSAGGYAGTGRVIRVSGPYPADPLDIRWFKRPYIDGWCVKWEYLDPAHLVGQVGWMNEVFVEGGRIYAHPWRDEIVVVERSPMQQIALF